MNDLSAIWLLCLMSVLFADIYDTPYYRVEFKQLKKKCIATFKNGNSISHRR